MAICSTWECLHTELCRVKQILVNNNFPNHLIDNTFRNTLGKLYTQISGNGTSQYNKIALYFKGIYTSSALKQENLLKTILLDSLNCSTVNQISLRVFYKPLSLENILSVNKRKICENHVVYKYQCPISERICSDSYIGYTTQTLQKRIKQHSIQGSIREHIDKSHNFDISLKENSFSILFKSRNKIDLQIAEALFIKDQNPEINIQTKNFTRSLKIF